jgi:hypothetical protein
MMRTSPSHVVNPKLNTTLYKESDLVVNFLVAIAVAAVALSILYWTWSRWWKNIEASGTTALLWDHGLRGSLGTPFYVTYCY